jgi:hypothetical protein
MNPWLANAAAHLAAAAGLEEDELALTSAEAERVLALASLAAHESGARLNAPLVCFLAGRAAASGVPVDLLVSAAGVNEA